MIKAYLISAFLVLFHTCLHAQDFVFGSLMPADVKLAKNDLDSSSNAAVLNEYGKAFMVYNDTKGYTELIVDYHVRIKIFNSDGYEHADIVLPSYKDESGERTDVLSEIKAVTINVNDGRVVSIPLDKGQLFKEEVSKYLTNTKFTFPSLQDGSIIEYSYRLVSPHIFNFKTWQLQDDIPKVNSLFEALIPGMYTYNVILRGPYPLDIQDAKLKSGCFRIAGRDIDCSHMTYGMKNIPAFVEEDYMTSAMNFKSAIYFELSDIYRLDGSNIKITKEWRNVDRELVSHPDFGGQMKRDNVFKPILPAILAGASDDLGKAKALHRYIQRNIKWNRYLGKYSENNIKNALERRSGNIGDINLALIAGLRAAGLDAEAVMLSTRDNGVVNDIHPVLSDFNYVVAKVNIGDSYYLLDASDPFLPFGLLPLHCINGKARVVNLKEPSYWIEPKSSQKSTTQYTLTAELHPDGRLTGQLVTHSHGYTALHKRRELANYNTTEEYIEHIDEIQTGFTILGGEIKGVAEVEEPLVERYDVEVKLYDGLNTPELFFNPFFINRVTKNPFNLDERTYPVDMGAASEERVLMTIKLPSGYELKAKPDDYNMALENKGGRYLTQTQLAGETLTFSQLLALNHATYAPESYFALKEFFSRIIQQEKIDVVLQKTGG
ncbi:transglutaminase domain-containing protein [Parapedobacter pyrenivorans]|uniref:transglutaminase domain-containing protein n=1 Tax=Parapedobacter pyrenivorans TaxID=1305674 RepID=UPI0033411442